MRKWIHKSFQRVEKAWWVIRLRSEGKEEKNEVIHTGVHHSIVHLYKRLKTTQVLNNM